MIIECELYELDDLIDVIIDWSAGDVYEGWDGYWDDGTRYATRLIIEEALEQWVKDANLKATNA